MSRPIHITGVRKDPPDLDRFVAALLALALARVEATNDERQADQPVPDTEDSDE